MPNFVCEFCCEKLKKGYEFKIMCVKNHLALKDYAKQLLKYMESPINNHLFNLKLNNCESESTCDTKEQYSSSDSESENVKEEYDSDIKDEPLALVKKCENKDRIKVEESDSDYQCEDLSKKEIKREIEDVNEARELPGKESGYNMTNDMVMKYLKLEYADKDAASRSNGKFSFY